MSGEITITLPAMQREIAISPEWVAERDALIKSAQTFTAVEGADAFEQASHVMARITKTSNALETIRKKISDPFAKAAKTIKAVADKAREPLETEKTRLQGLLNEYAAGQRRRQAEEQRRIEEEERKQVEKQLAERQELEDMGLADADEEFVPQIDTPAAVVMAPSATAARIAERVEWEVVDLDKVPRAYLMLDPRTINALIRDGGKDLLERVKAGADIVPGIKFTVETKVAAR